MTDQQYLLLYVTAPDGEPWSAESDDIQDWLDTVDPTGIRVLGERLTDRSDSRGVVKRAGAVTVTDAPLAEFKEWFVGFDLVNAPDIDAAVEIGSRHPAARFSQVVVLPLMDPVRSDELSREAARAHAAAARE